MFPSLNFPLPSHRRCYSHSLPSLLYGRPPLAAIFNGDVLGADYMDSLFVHKYINPVWLPEVIKQRLPWPNQASDKPGRDQLTAMDRWQGLGLSAC